MLRRGEQTGFQSGTPVIIYCQIVHNSEDVSYGLLNDKDRFRFDNFQVGVLYNVFGSIATSQYFACNLMQLCTMGNENLNEIY